MWRFRKLREGWVDRHDTIRNRRFRCTMKAVNKALFFRTAMRWMVGLALALVGIGFIFSLILHSVTFFVPQVATRMMFMGHIALMILGAFTVLVYRIRSKLFDETPLPHWTKKALLFLLGYFVLNMVLIYVAFEGGSPTAVNGTYELSDHGRFIRALGREEYEHDAMLEIRFFTSGWIASYGALLAYLARLWSDLRAGFREIVWSPKE